MKKCLTFLALTMVIAMVAPTAWAQEANTVVINHFVSSPNMHNYVYITDVEGYGPPVIVSFYSMEGELLKQKSTLVPEWGTEWIEIYPLLNARTEGNVVIESSGGRIAGQYWQLGYNEPDVNRKVSVALPAQEVGESKALVIQHYVSDNTLDATIYVTDGVGAGGAGTVIDLEFFDESSNLLLKTRHLIPSHGTVAFSPWNFLTPKKTTGTVYISSRGVPITGEYWQIAHQEINGEKIDYAVAVPATATAKAVSSK